MNARMPKRQDRKLGMSPLIMGTFLFFVVLVPGRAATQATYYAHEAVEDRYGVIAPWYRGQNGQCDFRVRVSAETLKRYPWADANKAPTPAPEYVYNGGWSIARDGTITIPRQKEW